METHIDPSSVYGVRMALTTDERSEWAKKSFYDVTLLALLEDELFLSRPRKVSRAPTSSLLPIADLIRTSTGVVPEQRKKEAHEAKRKWLRDQGTKHIQGHVAVLKDNLEFQRWVSWHVDVEWADHIRIVEGLIEKKNIAAVAKVAGKTKQEICEVNEQACRDTKRFIAQANDYHRELFAADVLIRGKYYDELAKMSARQLVHHPVRRCIFHSPPVAHVVDIPSPAYYLAAIIGNVARKEKQCQDRMPAWQRLVRECRAPLRQVCASQNQKLRELRGTRKGERMARDKAVELAKQAGVTRFYWADPWIDWLSAAVGGTVGFVVASYALSQGHGDSASQIEGETAEATTASLLQFSLRRGKNCVEGWAIGRLAKPGPGRVFFHAEVKAEANA